MILGGEGGAIGGVGGGVVKAMAVGKDSDEPTLGGGATDCSGPCKMRSERSKDLPEVGEGATW